MGSIQHGAHFILESLKALKKGGFALHTVEMTLSSDDHTIFEGSTVFWRKRDIEGLWRKLKELEYTVFPLNFGTGLKQYDLEIDHTGRKENHFRYATEGHVITSFAIIIQK